MKRAAALSGMMLIAGCAGGGGSGGAPQNVQSNAANTARAYLEIDIPSRATARKGRAPASTRRRISYVSPATASVNLTAMLGSTMVYQTSFAIGPPLCAPATTGSGYVCPVNLPVGTYTLYGSLYDASGNVLSTNAFASPGQTTIYANGSSGSNVITIPDFNCMA